MKYVVIDTNVVVSAMISDMDHGHPAAIVRRIVDGNIIPVYSKAIIEEYREVLSRKKFGFQQRDIATMLGIFTLHGIEESRLQGMSWIPECSDPDDQGFFDLAHSTDAILITGNMKHFPEDVRVTAPAAFNA